ncbi:MAG TPA: hypothetical protein PK880_03325 [Candidatus Competibacter sp.]|nr:hypothetical protein [Candidatus Competibacteraceae bacterium]HRC71547.1 hypothetical protein [Candidatus Competibacter sp.]
MTDRDDELHDETIAALYRPTRQAEPPEWLDRRVLMAAGAAVGSRAPTPSKPRKNRWTMPLALAATVVLTVGVVRVVRESGEFKSQARMEAVVPMAGPAAREDAAAVGNAGPATAGRVETSAKPAPPAAPAEAPISPPAAASEGATRNNLTPSSPPPAAPAHPVARAAPAEPAELKEHAPAVDDLKKDEALRGRKRAFEAGMMDDRDPLFRRQQEEWLKKIAELRRQGRTAEAEAELAEFRRRHPQYPSNGDSAPR